MQTGCLRYMAGFGLAEVGGVWVKFFCAGWAGEESFAGGFAACGEGEGELFCDVSAGGFVAAGGAGGVLGGVEKGCRTLVERVGYER